MVITADAVGHRVFDVVHCPENMRLMVIPIIRIMDAVACVRKYFVDASMVRGLGFFMRIGMMASVFISKPIQMVNQWELVNTIMVPEITVSRMVRKIGGLISTGRV